MSCADPHHCVTCGDDGVPMTVVAVDRARGLALCSDSGGGRHTVETALVDPVSEGDGLLVHAGTAIARCAVEAVEAVEAIEAVGAVGAEVAR